MVIVRAAARSEAVDPVYREHRRSALDRVYREHRGSLLRLAILLTDGDLMEAEDCVQDAFVGLFRRWDALPDPSGAVAYLKVSIVNRSRSGHRRRAVAKKHLHRLVGRDVAVAADVSVLLAEEHREIVALVAGLPRRQRAALTLRYWGEMSIEEVADALHVSPGTVKSSISRAISTIASKLEA